MSVDARSVQVGDWISWDGETWTIVAFGGLSLQLRSRGQGGVVSASSSEVLTAIDFAVLKSSTSDALYGRVAANPLDGYPEEVRQTARRREAELMKMWTGYPTDHSSPTEVRDPSFDGLTAKQRYARLGERMGITQRQVERWVRAYNVFGLVGLVDERYENLSGGIGRIDPVLVQAMLAVIDRGPASSRVTNIERRREVAAELAVREGAPELPIQRTFDRYWAKVTAHLPLHLSLPSQRNAASRPTGVVPWLTITRPMEWVLLDSSPLDMFALDPMAEGGEPKWHRVWLSLAIDVFSRSIVGWIFTSNEPRSEDIALLLYRIASPKSANPRWPAHGRWRYTGVPASLVFAEAHDVVVQADPTAGIPFGHVETYVVDHGKVYISLAVREAARILRTNLQLARVRTPTDKAPVEAVFGRVREQFVMRLPGYKGPNIAERGTPEYVEKTTFMFLWEIEEAFAEWVACDYQNTHHHGLVLQSCPELELTPNDAYDFGVTRSGRLPVPPRRNLLIELLPTEWRTIQHYGVEINLVRYDDDVLNDFRSTNSPWVTKKGRWKFKRDRSDRSRIWFWAIDSNTLDPTVGSWKPIAYRGWDDCPLFGDEEVAYAKAIVLGNGGSLRNREVFESTLDRVIRRIAHQQALPNSERTMAGRTYLRALSMVSAKIGAASRWADTFGPTGTGVANSPSSATSPIGLRSDTRSVDPGPATHDDLVSDLSYTVLNGPEEVELEYFADADADADPDADFDDLAGTENLADELDVP